MDQLEGVFPEELLLKVLREAGAVETGRRRIVVKDAEALGRIANEVA